MESDDKLAKLWKLTGLLEPVAADEVPPTTVQMLRRRMLRRPSAQRSRRWVGLLAGSIAIAAGLVVAFAAGRFLATSAGRSAHHLAAAEYSTGPTESASVALGDGSIVRLSPGSRLRVLESDSERAVWLSGQALFAVAKGRGRFVVRTTAGEAVALGTRFDVKVHGGDLDLTVVEGRVALTSGTSRVEVVGRQRALVRNNQLQGAPLAADPEAGLQWVGNFVVFQSTPLGEVAVELSRRYRTSVRVADSGLARETVTGAFDNEPLDDVLKVLCRSISARCTTDRSGATIEP